MGNRSGIGTSILAVVFAAGLAHATPVRFSEVPKDLQLYPRGDDDRATVRARGTVLQEGYIAVEVEAFRDGSPLGTLSAPLAYENGRAPFALSYDILAGLHSYEFRMALVGDGERVVIGERRDIVCGDVLLIQGQSNAAAMDYWDEGLANQNQRSWIRTFGTPSIYGGEVRADTTWYVADGEEWASGSIGTWGLRMAQLLSEAEGIPMAILNGAVGATPIAWHLRDDSDPENLGTIYGRLLWRARRAGLADAARAIFWYQGETNANGNPRVYGEKFRDLHGDWNEDFPGLEKTYVVQFRDGCGAGPAESVDIRDLQGRAGDYLADVETMSTTALDGHDGCHYFFVGYRQLGERMARLVSRDLYGGTDVDGISAPRVREARQDVADEIRLVFDSDHQMRWDAGSRDYFRVDGGAGVSGGRAEGNEIVLELSAPRAASTVTYLGHAFDGPWVTNQRGIGILVFDRIAVVSEN